jgi:hypothetical protein
VRRDDDALRRRPGALSGAVVERIAEIARSFDQS